MKNSKGLKNILISYIYLLKREEKKKNIFAGFCLKPIQTNPKFLYPLSRIGTVVTVDGGFVNGRLTAKRTAGIVSL